MRAAGAGFLCAAVACSAPMGAAGAAHFGVPHKTGDFVAWCAGGAHADACLEEVIDVSIEAEINAAGHCTTPDGLEPQVVTAKVLVWLTQHAEAGGLPTNDGVALAIDHLWPCHK